MKNRVMRFLRLSIVAIVAVCILIFSFLAVYINYKCSETINSVGKVYMEEMSRRIELHFESTIESRLARVEYLIERVSPQARMDYDTMSYELAYGADARGLASLALYSENGNLENLYGEEFYIADPEPFLQSLKNGEKKIAYAETRDGLGLIVYGVPAEYPMQSGEKCTALLGTITLDYLNQLLVLDEDNTLVYSHIIRRDGSFVISSNSEKGNNYLDLIRNEFLGFGGKTTEDYYREITEAMLNQTDYTETFYRSIDGTRELRSLYMTALPYSEWYLVTVMPYGYLNETVSSLGTHWAVAAIGGCGIILIVVGAAFAIYVQMAKHQMLELDKARDEAVKATEAKSMFLSNMSHDIRTPMNAIVGMTAIATANIDDKQQVRSCLKKITLSSKHLLGLINDVLDMSKIESGKMTLSIEQISLREVMDSIVSIIQPQIKEKRQSFDVLIRNINSENVYCDGVRLNQVIINLLSNAIKFTPEGGSINVILQEEESPKGSGFARIHLYVRDNGIGMTTEFKEKIFESFSREDRKRIHKTEGTGLGMAITKCIVDAMSGTIEVDSVKGQGTEFHVTLDLEKACDGIEEMVLPDWNMLVVDDDRQLCGSAVASLEEIGIKADWALNGETALDMVTMHHEQGNDYHVILLDWQMPGMDGVETAREIRRRVGDDVPIMLISAYDCSDIESEARDAGINGFISKPLFKSTLFYGLKRFAENTHTEEDNAVKPSVLEGRRVIVAEDNDINWEIAEIMLDGLGIKAERAENGKICTEMFGKSEAGYYDAILMDLRMPVMSGIEATEVIRKTERPDADIPIIAMTADAFSEDVQRCLACGMNAHISKPIDPQEIMRQLEKHILARNK